MKKGNRYTLIMAALLFLVVFGGWFLMDKLLSAKQNQILSQKGQVAIPSVVNDDKNRSTDIMVSENDQNDFTGKVLSEEEIAEVLSVWETGGRQIPHEPFAGQMSMKQAIDKGCRWIGNLAEAKILPDEMRTTPFDSITAKLFTLENDTDIEMQMLSMWEITYTKNDVKIYMKIHAWSGEIWMADITMDKESVEYEECMDERLLGMAFPSFSWRDSGMSAHLENGVYYEIGKNGSVYIMLQRYSEVRDNPHFGFCLWLETKVKNKN